MGRGKSSKSPIASEVTKSTVVNKRLFSAISGLHGNANKNNVFKLG